MFYQIWSKPTLQKKKKKLEWNKIHIMWIMCSSQVKLCASFDCTQSWRNRMHDASTCISS
jgi:hypothetical protein